MVAVTPKNFRLQDSFTPANFEYLNKTDLDLGSGNPVVFPFQKWTLAAVVGKESVIYLLDANNLGGADHHTPLYTSPRWGNDEAKLHDRGIWGITTGQDPQGRRWLYVPMLGPPAKDAPKFPQSYGAADQGSTMAFEVRLDAATGKPTLAPMWMSREMHAPEPPTVANGVVYVLLSGKTSDESRGAIKAPAGLDPNAVLYALDAETGRELYSSNKLIAELHSFQRTRGCRRPGLRLHLGRENLRFRTEKVVRLARSRATVRGACDNGCTRAPKARHRNGKRTTQQILMESKLIKTIFFACLASIAGVILTPDAWGADTVVYAIVGGSDSLGTIDLNTGVFTPISTVAVSDYELGAYGGALYGAGLQCGCLFQLNPSTGVPTFAPTYFQQNASGFGALNGFGSTSNGLFAMAAAVPGGINYLWSINPATGVPTQIGSTGVVAGGGTGYLSASNDSTQLYWEVQNGCTDTLYGINASTGAATMIGTAGACYPSPAGNPFSMVFTGGVLWANFYSAGFGTINTSTGAQTLVSTGKSVAFFGIAPYPLAAPAPPFAGSMAHIAAEENWITTFTLVNKGGTASQSQLNFFGDPSDPTGIGPLTLPLVFPQQPTASPLLAASYSQTVAANASLIVATGGPQTPPVVVGSAQLAATGAVDGFAIFHQIVTEQEAVVPMETRNASSYLLAFDNTGGVVLGVAVENVSAQAGNVGVILRDDTGAQIGTGNIAVQANGHQSFVLSDPTAGFPVTANIRGTAEFDTPAGGQISVLGIRFTPPNNALTTIPALASVGTNGGSIAHIATGNGWQTTFVLVNTGTTAASVYLNFFADATGTPLTLPISFPQQGNTVTNAASVTQTLAAGASLLVLSDAPASNPMPTTGSAQLTTNGNVSGFVIFRYNPNGQEAVVPLESRTASGFIIAFDNTNGTATGIAVNSVSGQSVNAPVIVRDDAGNQLATDTLNLSANGHLAFTLGSSQPGYKYPQTAGIRGTLEFDTPAGGQIGALGIRIPVAHTFTTLPALVK